MPEISLSSRLPGGDANGLGSIAGPMVSNPHNVHVLVVLVDCAKTVTDCDTGDTIPVARIRRVEAIKGQDDIATCERLVRRAIEQRTGQTVLPMDLEDELNAAFENIDPSTGEVKRTPPANPEGK
jgi:hypothetical protein